MERSLDKDRKALRQDLNEDKEYLAEMAKILIKSKPQSFIAKINNEDHDPPHVHLYYTNKKLAGVFLITQQIPDKNKISDILDYKGKKILDAKAKGILCRWANEKNDETIVNWNEFKVGWRQTRINKNEKIKFVDLPLENNSQVIQPNNTNPNNNLNSTDQRKN